MPIFVLVGTLSVRNMLIGMDMSARSVIIDTAVFLSVQGSHLTLPNIVET